MTYQPYFPPTSPASAGAAFMGLNTNFAPAAADPVVPPERLDDKSSFEDRQAYYEAWVADECAAEQPAPMAF